MPAHVHSALLGRHIAALVALADTLTIRWSCISGNSLGSPAQPQHMRRSFGGPIWSLVRDLGLWFPRSAFAGPSGCCACPDVQILPCERILPLGFICLLRSRMAVRWLYWTLLCCLAGLHAPFALDIVRCAHST
ncbi:hypothetical protein C8Q73DRAFT_160135 [Cubamyces lactineus]|nr:hypothetical protein C8Q73DRAFT_160135 [Cubamyces lactineus]